MKQLPLATHASSGGDADGDGIGDVCEQVLAERYAPVVYHSSDETNYPTNVDWFLPRTSLRFYDDSCTPDYYRTFVAAPSQANLLGHSVATSCGSTSTVSSDGTRSRHKHRTFFLGDVPDLYRIGSLDSRDWTTYYHAYPNAFHGVTVQYWRFYAYNDAANNHGGDWEGIHVVLDSNLAPLKVGFLGHSSIDYSSPSGLTWEGNHPRIFSEGGGHASHPDGAGVFALSCSGLGSINPNDPCTFTRQEAWTGGHVQWCRNAAGSHCTGQTTPGGKLLDLGEKTAPMNGQVFIRYSGLWGSPGTFFFTSGYWDPAFNETGMSSDGFLTAWCADMLRPTEVIGRECYPATVSD